MAWLQLTARIDPEKADLLERLLTDEGACAITLEDGADTPVFEPELGTTPLWRHTVLKGLYDDVDEVDAMLVRVRQGWKLAHADLPAPAIEYAILPDQDWTRAWMDDFHPIQMGKKLWIVPSWHEPPQADAVNLILDPGLAFGSGTHPTTALCLEWLDQQAVADRLQERTLLDVGCGSGILAIAGLKLGALRANGTDIDPQALLASRDNAQRNGIEDNELGLYYPHQAPQTKYDIVIANILAGPLIELAPLIASSIAATGRFALSGILAHQAAAVVAAYEAQGLYVNPPEVREEWVRIDGHRPQ